MKIPIFTSTLAALFTGSLLSLSSAASEVQTEGAKVGQWTMDYEAATKLAKEKKLPMLLNFTGSDWCGWCKLMDGNVFAKDAWQDYAEENAVLVTIDFPKDTSIVPEKYVERNQKLQEKFEVQGFPTYVILDSDGETVLGQLGAGREKTPESFVEEFKNVTRMSESSIEAYAKANPDKAEAYKAAIKAFRDTKQELVDWIATGPERNEENNKTYEDFQKRLAEAQAKVQEFK